jgi:hypothetical protein
MASPILLNNIDHGDVRILTGHGAAFGDAINQVTVFPTEYEALQREYPILFRRDPDGVYYSVALLGLDLDENLFLGEDGWQGQYVPALLQRGPFSIGVPGQGPNGEPLGEPMIHIDLDHVRVTRGADQAAGHPIFLPQGGNSPYLDHVAGVLRAIFTGIEVTKTIFAAFEEYGLIEPIAIEIQVGNGRQYNVPDCYTISRERLMQLDGAALEKLHRADFLRAAIWVASSLQNIGRLVDTKTRREAAA